MECDIRFAWIIFLCILSKVLSVDAIVLRKGPDNKTVYEGDTVTFECIVAYRGASSVLWVFGGTRFISVGIDVFGYNDKTEFNKRCTIINDITGQYKLQIFNVSRADEGMFECYYTKNKATGSFGKPGGAKLTVLEIGTNSPVCGAHTSDPPLRPYQKVLLNCSSASHNFAVKWDNGTNAMTGFKYGRQVTEVILTPFDNGRVFTCTEVNPATYKTHNCSLMPMNILPTADIYPRRPEIGVNRDITFTCNATGLPYITKYTWIHDGYVIANDNFYPMKYNLVGDGRKLTIRGVGMTDDQSTIVCQAYVRAELYNVASTTITVSVLPIYLSTSTPLTMTQSTLMTTELTTGHVFLDDDGYKNIRAFALSLPAVVASVIVICVLFIVSVSLMMLACHRKPKAMLDLPDITARRGRSPGTFIPSVSGGISHNNFIYAELFNDIDFQNVILADEYHGQSVHEDEILEPLIDGNGQSFIFHNHHDVDHHELVAPPLPPKPTRLIAPDLYTEIPEIYHRNTQPSPVCDGEMLYCGTELSVRSSSEATEQILAEPDEIYYQIPDRTSLVIPDINSDHCHSKRNSKRRSRNPSPCGCDEQSRTTCPSYARVKKANRPERDGYGLGNLERRILIPMKCDDLTSAELYDVNTPLLEFNTERELCLDECYSDQIYNVIPEDHVQHHHHTMMVPSRRPSRTRRRSRLRRSKSCPKNNPYEDLADDITNAGSFISNLRVAESAPNLVETQACQNRGRGKHIYETVSDKIKDNKLYKAKSDDILSKGSSDITCDVDSSEYMDMECADINDYI